MEIIIKSFFGVFFTLLLLTLGIGIISSSIDARNANLYLSNCVSELQASNYAKAVADECKEKASRAGYELVVDVRHPPNYPDRKYAMLTLTYHYRVPILGLDDEHTIKADIR